MLNLSRFQKNTLLTFSLLAFVAYAPLYYSIRNAIHKETLPITYESPDSVSFFSLGEWEIEGKESDKKTLLLLSDLIDFEFKKLTGAVYLGREVSLSLPKKTDPNLFFMEVSSGKRKESLSLLNSIPQNKRPRFRVNPSLSLTKNGGS